MHIIKQWYYSYKIKNFTNSFIREKSLNKEDEKTKKFFEQFKNFLEVFIIKY